jgi:uncharacterized repeat protein (TIGR01451 family)
MRAFGFNRQSWFRRPARKASPIARPARGFEQLEPRTLMAADMAEILGVVRVDLQGDGDASNDQSLAGATVSIFRDNGNGSLDAGDAAAKNAVTTDVSGNYRFSGLTAGTYFVKVDPPANSQFKAGEGVRTVVISTAEAEGTIGQTIDGFTTFQKVSASPPLPSSNPASLVDGAVMGGERDMFVELTQGTDPFSGVSLVSGGGLMRLSSDSTVTGNAKLVWDGADGSATAINHTGLGGLNFTTYNGNTMTGIVLKSGADHPNSIIKLRIYTDANHWTEFTTTVPETVGGAATGFATFNFADVPTASGGGGADFANVGAVELTFTGVTAVDGQVSLVGLIGMATKRADFTAAPRLALGDKVWADADNDGLLDSGEAGIAGVKLNAYLDSNGDNQYSAGVDTFVATTTTDGAGNYMFMNLLPGKYVVQVDPSNFVSGGALAGLISSTGKTATDPDDGVDNDDNGSPLAGAGVVSQAVMLMAGSTAADGDNNDRTDKTVDFGFYGFDLVLDKSVDKGDRTPVSPTETLRYTVTITNSGPSIAKDAYFVDDFPAGIAIQSYQVSRAGVTLENNGRSLLGNLGNMAAGDVVTITIFATVKSSATGNLINYARVEARDEVNLTNNKDQVENPVTPKIDLMVDKSDTKDPVKPGEVFGYTLKVTNNGPSDATGVVLTDNLPPGITLVSTTATNVGSAGQLKFNLGNLANGASTTVGVQVRVNSDFTGTLLNQTEVKGNEVEITYTNNVDTEPTQVSVDPASLSGFVYVDKNNNGRKDSGEAPISGVVMTLSGTDMHGASVSRTTVTAGDGSYNFTNLLPGTYNVTETHPTRYKDGRESLGENGDGSMGTQLDGLIALDLNEGDDFDADRMEAIQLDSGYAAKDYNFGELAVTTSKAEFVRPMRWR